MHVASEARCTWPHRIGNEKEPSQKTHGLSEQARAGGEPRWQAGSLIMSAASVLLFREVLTTPLAQKYMELLKAVASRAPAERLLDAYGSFYSRLVATGNSSWQEYIVDQVKTHRPLGFHLFHCRTRNSSWQDYIVDQVRTPRPLGFLLFHCRTGNSS